MVRACSESAGDTILRVGQEIVRRQKAFFLEADRPLKTNDFKKKLRMLCLFMNRQLVVRSMENI